MPLARTRRARPITSPGGLAPVSFPLAARTRPEKPCARVICQNDTALTRTGGPRQSPNRTKVEAGRMLPGPLRDLLSLDVALYDGRIVWRHVGIELANLRRFRAVPGAVDFREDCIGRRGDDAALDQARQGRPVGHF